jgi:hypothetical protein
MSVTTLFLGLKKKEKRRKKAHLHGTETVVTLIHMGHMIGSVGTVHLIRGHMAVGKLEVSGQAPHTRARKMMMVLSGVFAYLA